MIIEGIRNLLGEDLAKQVEAALKGNNRTEREPVRTVGSMITGIAIPVSVPKTESASARLQPKAVSADGMRMASALANRLRVTRLPVSGAAKQIKRFVTGSERRMR